MDAPSTRTELARAVARASSDYLLRALRLITDLQDGELLTAIIVQAIIAANTSHVAHAKDGLPPDESRRPISILALAGSLGLPFETTRRHVGKLIAAGACRRVKGGVIVPASALDDAKYLAAAETNLDYVRHFVRALRRAGFSVDDELT